MGAGNRKKISKFLSVWAVIIIGIIIANFDDNENPKKYEPNNSQSAGAVTPEKSGHSSLLEISNPNDFIEFGEAYSSTDEVAAYLNVFEELPPNYLTKAEAKELGWVSSEGNLWNVTAQMSIGGDYFGNYEGLLPEEDSYREADVNYKGGYREAERIIFSDDGDIYYTPDHYQTFELLYKGDE